ncbi:MAG TPA: HNH endonuclease [Nitrospirae bacterium]|nr:hypothetical protein BMS3Abin06_01354 [bacterium BMS3Abin06]HDH12257.1 HNH endonuclease [Nitrospirota bacterium]HDZ01133.1 HNH endonuclease [Nitrospirota bacterium]
MSPEDFVCIYCGKTAPEAAPSVSHLIPDFLGGVLELHNAVCIGCNTRVNREIEEPMRKPFAYLRSGLDLRGRRRREIKVPAKVRILGVELETCLSSDIQIPPFEYHKVNDEKGLVIIGKKDYVEEEKRKIDSNPRKAGNGKRLKALLNLNYL